MASKDDIIPQITLDPCSQIIYATVRSSAPRHWFLLWSLFPPAKTPRTKTVRGVSTTCGYTYSAAGFKCVEQLETGDTINHTFILPEIPYGAALYWMISATCNPRSGFFTSAPLVYRFEQCDPFSQSYKFTSTVTGAALDEPNGTAYVMNAAIYDNMTCLHSFPASDFILCGAGIFTLRWHLTLHEGSQGEPTTVRCFVRRSGEPDLNLGIISIGPNETVTETFVTELTATDPGQTNFQLRAASTPAPGLIGPRFSLIGDAPQWMTVSL